MQNIQVGTSVNYVCDPAISPNQGSAGTVGAVHAAIISALSSDGTLANLFVFPDGGEQFYIQNVPNKQQSSLPGWSYWMPIPDAVAS